MCDQTQQRYYNRTDGILPESLLGTFGTFSLHVKHMDFHKCPFEVIKTIKNMELA